MPNRWQMFAIYPVCLLAALVMAVWLPIAILLGSDRAMSIMVASDRLANTVFGGSDRETISSRSNRGMLEGVKGWCFLCRLLDIVQKDHCAKSKGY